MPVNLNALSKVVMICCFGSLFYVAQMKKHIGLNIKKWMSEMRERESKKERKDE